MDNVLHDPTRIALGARWKGAVIGGALLEIEDRTAALRMLHVDAAWRGQGTGRRLLQSLLRRARYQLVRDVHVLATSADAGFYALHGFRPADARGEDAPSANRLMRASTDTDGASITPMRRRLTTGLVNTPIDGITVKI